MDQRRADLLVDLCTGRLTLTDTAQVSAALANLREAYNPDTTDIAGPGAEAAEADTGPDATGPDGSTPSSAKTTVDACDRAAAGTGAARTDTGSADAGSTGSTGSGNADVESADTSRSARQCWRGARHNSPPRSRPCSTTAPTRAQSAAASR